MSHSSRGRAHWAPLFIVVLLAGVAGSALAITQGSADAQGPPATMVDTSACPTAGTDAELVADPLSGPEAEDDYTEETEPEEPLPSAAPAAPPNQNLKPTVRAPNSQAGALAAADAQTPSVHLGLIRWCVIERNDPDLPLPPGEVRYDWSAYDDVLDRYQLQGVPVASIKVTDPPTWAVYPGCADDAALDRVKKCPPRPQRDPELWAFARGLARHYGPSDVEGEGYKVPRISFWNEPNLPDNWGNPKQWSKLTETEKKGLAYRYSDRLTPFFNGATTGDPAIKVDAGEIAAGGNQAKGNGVRAWARYFTDYNHQNYPAPGNPSRDRNYDVLAIHAYSEVASQIPKKVASYRARPGVGAVGVTEAGWAKTNQSNNWKCAGSEEEQRTKFNNALNAVRTSNVGVQRLVWFNLIDSSKEGPPCPDASWYNQSPAPGEPLASTRTNTYGLYKRDRDGTLQSFAPDTRWRLLRTAFRNAQQ